ncbi:MAG TPA: ArgP/LysG family DNA-binding transcriptional regulator [Candidatus Nesterenkonia stercoripullorum]|uniref:ArgP/LysG family DNA-binding transcriptional regulator n=1 Tax=Candidatus Nesterenkonia stercoripullorum TaxID=2838701 RepID=A0A9D1S1J3_9MICC|nr:ArgP/LysG family DNA-binding transcriptional regulator [Candidatus Nesterenkonia stercoripullorum]
MNTDHLRAFVTAVDEGTFDAAAALLGISGSAFSQRIKALEKEVGHVLVTRTVPVAPTASGTALLRIARQTVMLEDEARRSLKFGTSGQGSGISTLAVAVNADSLATWFIRVLQEAATWDDVELHLVAEDQEHTHELLRDGSVAAAITDRPTAIPGCRSTSLGTMTYWPVASAQLLDRHRGADGLVAWHRVPLVDFTIRDSLQRNALRRLTGGETPVTHLVPSVEAYNAAVRFGLGWGMMPEIQMPAKLLEGTHADLVMIPELGVQRAALHWQHWSSTTPVVDRLTAAVQRAARILR